MPSLQALCRVHGGTHLVQSGTGPGERRDYWLIHDTLQSTPLGRIGRSVRIQRSWGMRRQLATGELRVLPVYALVFIIAGRGAFRDDRGGAARPVEAGDVLCLFPGIGHAYAPPAGGRWDEISIEFAGPAFDAWMGAGLLDPAQPVRRLAADAPERRAWLARFQAVVLPLARAGAEPGLPDIARLVSLIAGMCARWQRPAEAADADWAARARAWLLARPPHGELDLVAAARPFGLGEQAYRKRFRRLCGVTPSAFWARLRIERACQALAASTDPVKRIAFALGFPSEPYFSRRFKQLTGLSPGEYRRRAEG